MKIGKIETAEQAAAVVKRMSATNRQLLIQGLRAQHPNLRNASDREISRLLTQFVQRNS